MRSFASALLRGASLVVLGMACLAPDVAPAAGDAGAVLYKESCAVCHGANGDGRGEAASKLATAPRDLAKGVYKFRSTASGALPTDQDLRRSIVCGIPGTGMVPQDHLSEEQVVSVIEFVKSLSPAFKARAAGKPLALPSPVPSTPAAIERGRVVYVENGCVQCHGQEGRGDGTSAKSLSVRPTDFHKTPLKSGSEPIDLVRTMLTGLDGTPMPSYHLMIPDADVWALAYYLDSLGGAPIAAEDVRLGWEIEKRTPSREPAKDCE